jgi:hypothetical protein
MNVKQEFPNDKNFFEVFLRPLWECKKYSPAFGRGKTTAGTSFGAFEEIYGGDPFYAWLGLNSEEVYAAHKAAGGLTSVYRQLGIGAERLFRAVLAEEYKLTEEQLSWSYEYSVSSAKTGVHTLDAKIMENDLLAERRCDFNKWTVNALKAVDVSGSPGRTVDGVAFEVRQGYKSADSKRQNADLRFGIQAYRHGLLPAFAVFSNQVSKPVLTRYRADGMLVLTGTLSDDPTISTFAFFEQVVGYDMAGFFRRNTEAMAAEVQEIVSSLLRK